MPGQVTDRRPLFVGMKMDGTLRRLLRGLTGADRRYVSEDDPSFLMICRFGEDQWVGKRIDERLSTDRVDDVRRNVLSILARLCPDVRLPQHLDILTWDGADPVFKAPDPAGAEEGEDTPDPYDRA